MIAISTLAVASEAALADINRLLPQLRIDPGERPASLADLQAITASPATRLIVARDGERIVGMATLHVVPTLAKCLAHVDAVVVDQAYRRRGIARRILEAAADAARALGAHQLKLTSRRVRLAANQLYPSLGFERRDSNVYVRTL